MVALAPSLRFSTKDLPAEKRLPFWREVFGRNILRLDIETLSSQGFDAEASLWSLPGLRLHRTSYSGPTRLSRPRELISEGDENIALILDLKGTISSSHAGSDVSLGRGAATCILQEKPALMEFPHARYMAVVAPLSAVRPLTRSLEDQAGRRIRRNNEALRLLARYLKLLCSDPAMSDAELSALAVSHVYDLMALVLGATRDGKALASERGVRAARLKSVKSFVIDNLGSHDLSVQFVAARHGLTPRYIHMLFEGEGVTFSAFVLEQRLLLARRMLRSMRHADMTIGAIAFASGFVDLSHFNRSFRRRFGATPGEVRSEGRPS
jgi:AraC-like DNA-binding protein